MFTMRRYKLPLFVLILLLAAAGRIINIGSESLWVDEGFSYWAIRHHDMFSLVINDVHPPLYFFGLRGWAELSGISELALRYFSVIPSLLSVAVIYHLARELELLRGRNTETIVPLLAALMMALADMENYIAQETRMYTWHVLWAIVSMWAFLRWIRLANYRPGKTFIAWIVSSLLLLYTHYIGAAAIAVQGLYALVFLRGKIQKTALIALSFIGIVFVPWLLVIVSGQTENVGTGFNLPSTLESLWGWRVNWFTQQWPLMIGLALLGLIMVVYRKKDDLTSVSGFGVHPFAPSFLMLTWFVVPVAGAYIMNNETPILMDYRLTQITPAVALMIAFGLGNLRQPALGVILAAIVLYGITTDDTAVKRPPWRDVGQNAALYAVPGDLALTHITPSGDWQVMYYYERFMPQDVERRSLRQWQLEDNDTYADGLPELLDQYEHVWFMHWSKDMSGFDALATTEHTQTAVMSEGWLGNDLNVYRFDVVPSQDEAIVSYENGMILRDAAIHESGLRVDLWWSVENLLDADYTVSALLLNEAGQLVAQDDSYPFSGQRPTSQWQTEEVIYDSHNLALAEGIDALSPGTYTVAVKVYLLIPGGGFTDIATAGGEDYFAINRVER